MEPRWDVILNQHPVLVDRTREQALNFVEGYCTDHEQVSVHVWQKKDGEVIVSEVKLERRN